MGLNVAVDYDFWWVALPMLSYVLREKQKQNHTLTNQSTEK